MPFSPPPTFTDAQLDAFYTRIRLPEQYRHHPSSSTLKSILSDPSGSLELLSAIMRHTLATVPFENLSLHYSSHHTISISTPYLFNKIVSSDPTSCHRGGYCMENNNLFLTVIRTLGFAIYSAGARINESVSGGGSDVPRDRLSYTGWSHMVNLVTLPVADGGSGTFLCDVGFGAGGPSRPVPLRDGETMVNMPGGARDGARDGGGGGAAQLVKLTKERLDQTARTGGSGSTDLLWLYNRRVEGGEFRPFYAFTEQEFFQADYEVMSHWTSTNRASWFTTAVVCFRKILDEGGEELVGEVALFGAGVKKRMYGVEVETRQFRSERDRLDALRDYFDIELDDEERLGITGLVSMIKPS